VNLVAVGRSEQDHFVTRKAVDDVEIVGPVPAQNGNVAAAKIGENTKQNGSVAGTSSMCPPIAARNETSAGEIQKRDSAAAAIMTTMRRSCKILTRLLECVTFQLPALMRINKGPITSPSTSTFDMVLVTNIPANSRVGRTAKALGATAKLKNIIDPSHKPSSRTSMNAAICWVIPKRAAGSASTAVAVVVTRAVNLIPASVTA